MLLGAFDSLLKDDWLIMTAYVFLPAIFAIENIVFSRLKVSRFRDMNDPYELFAASHDSAAAEVAYRMTKGQYDDSFGALCFSKSAEDPVMWAHYADKHQGIVLGFDIPEDGSECHITYTPDRLSYDIIEGNVMWSEAGSTEISLAGTKFASWAYEKEVRLWVTLEGLHEEGGLYFHPFNETVALREVILGPFCLKPVEVIRKLVDQLQPDVEVIKTRLDTKTYRVIADD